MSHPIAGVLADEERPVAWLARKCDLSVSYVWKMLNGERPLTEDFRAAAARALNRSEADLFVCTVAWRPFASTSGISCELPSGHDGQHHGGDLSWTDDEAAGVQGEVAS